MLSTTKTSYVTKKKFKLNGSGGNRIHVCPDLTVSIVPLKQRARRQGVGPAEWVHAPFFSSRATGGSDNNRPMRPECGLMALVVISPASTQFVEEFLRHLNPKDRKSIRVLFHRLLHVHCKIFSNERAPCCACTTLFLRTALPPCASFVARFLSSTTMSLDFSMAGPPLDSALPAPAPAAPPPSQQATMWSCAACACL